MTYDLSAPVRADIIGDVQPGPRVDTNGSTRRLRLGDGTIIDPATDDDIAEARNGWLRDLDRRFAMDLSLQIIHLKAKLKALQLRQRAERVAVRASRKEAP